jgi:PD-(D/E)XK nuclease superfamily
MGTNETRIGRLGLAHGETTSRTIGAAFEVHNTLGYGYADLLVDGCVIVEIKVAKCCNSEDEAQLLYELKATGVNVGVLANFGRERVEYNE